MLRYKPRKRAVQFRNCSRPKSESAPASNPSPLSQGFSRSLGTCRTGTMPHMIPAPGAFAAGVAIFLIVMWDAFEAIILPRRVTRRFRLTRLFYKTTWTTWRFIIGLVPSRKGRETLLGFFGPISLLILVGVWAAGLVFGFALMQYGAGSAVVTTGARPSFVTDLYLSGTTFFTLGLGDVVPHS